MIHWIRTYSKDKFDYDNPSNIKIGDISHGLSNMCRFSGQCEQFYSVAQHSVHCSEMALKETGDTKLAKLMLLHDATEAYVVDVPRPSKAILGEVYYKQEEKVKVAIFKQFEIDYEHQYIDKLKEIDNRMLITEANQIMDSLS